MPKLHLSAACVSTCSATTTTTARRARHQAHRLPASTSISYSHVIPKAGLTFDLSPSVNVFAAYRHGFRVPSENQLFVQGSATNSVGLNPVKANSFEAGYARPATAFPSKHPRTMMSPTTSSTSSYHDVYVGSLEHGKTRHRSVEVGVKVAFPDNDALNRPTPTCATVTCSGSRHPAWISAATRSRRPETSPTRA